jgi:hypothetical protein
VAERYRDIDFSRGKRGPVIKPEPGKTKISIRLDNAVLEHFRDLVHKAGEPGSGSHDGPLARLTVCTSVHTLGRGAGMGPAKGRC